MTEWTRRRFHVGALTALAFAGLARRASGAAPDLPYRNQVHGYGHLLPDTRGFLDLPPGFSYRTISRAGEPMDDGFVTPDKFDGMGCIGIGGGKLALVRNHELGLGDWSVGATGGHRALERRLAALPHFGRAADGRVLLGGTTTLILDAATGERERHFLSLVGTARNCAGGVTPWGSWLTCEETVETSPNTHQRHGWVFEVPARQAGLANPRPLKGLGRFRHEAAAVDPVSGIVYLTEDREDGLFYRFVPRRTGALADGGRLQALAFVQPDRPADSRNWTGGDFAVGASRRVRWVELTDVESPRDDLRRRGHTQGAVLFARGEGIHIGIGRNGAREIYFTCTSGGSAKLGQIMRYFPAEDRLELFVESSDPRVLDYADNVTVAPNGHLIVCEDRADGGPNHLRGVTPEGRVYALARLNADTELAGASFSPDGRTLFVNAYAPGQTLAITGPWDRFVP